MKTIIKKVFLNDKEVSEVDAKILFAKYVNSYMVMECFFGGVAIQTPEGILQAEVDLVVE